MMQQLSLVHAKKVAGNRFSFYFYPMPWKINDNGIAIDDIYMTDLSTRKNIGPVLTKDQTYTVRDVITLKCMQFLDVGVEEQINNAVIYNCPQCKTKHIAKKDGGRYIYFPENYFLKPEKNTRYNKLKRKIKESFIKKDEIEPLILFPIENPQEVPSRTIRRRKNKEIESDGG